jgi:hypothetical protein
MTATAPPTTTDTDSELFNAQAYELPIPRLDGRKADRITLTFTGTIELDRLDQDHLNLIERLELGHDIRLNTTATIAGKSFQVRQTDTTDDTGYRITLRIHTIE